LSQREFKELRDSGRKNGGTMIDIDIDEESMEIEVEEVEEERKTAVKMAFLGSGGGGGNLANAFYNLGYKRVAIINTTEKDMKRLQVPEENRLIMDSPGGAGKNPSVGKVCAEKEADNIRGLIQKVFKKGVEQIIICIGAGGGTGSGSIETLVKECKEYMRLNLVSNPEKRVGVMVTLPSYDESSAVQHNALEAFEELLAMAEADLLSPLVIVDNARVTKMYGGASIIDAYGKANKNTAALFDSFNQLAAIDDETAHQVFDPEDYKSVLEAGIMVFGRTKIDDVSDSNAVANSIRNNVKKGLLVEGCDISKAKTGAGIVVSNAEGLGSISTEVLEESFRSLNDLMHKGPETKLHRGIYEAGGSAIHLYTIIGNMGRPDKRIAELKARAGGGYPAS